MAQGPDAPPIDEPIDPLSAEIRVVEEYSEAMISDVEWPIGLLANSNGGCKEQNYSKKIQQKVNGQWITRVHVWSDTDFCYDGDYIVSPGPTWEKGDWYNEMAGWERVSWWDGRSGGVSWTFHSDSIESEYKQCLPFCGNHTEINVRKVQRGNGTTELHV